MAMSALNLYLSSAPESTRDEAEYSQLVKIYDALKYIADNFANVQGADPTLDALAAYNTNGFLVQTAPDTFAGRTLTGTANEISISNPAGTAGDPVFSLPAALTFTGKTITGGNYDNVQSFISGDGAGNAAVYVDAADGFVGDFGWLAGGSARWVARKDQTAESGSNAGSDFQLIARTDAGALLDIPISIVRAANGTITLARPTRINGIASVNTAPAAWSTTNNSILQIAGTGLIGNTSNDFYFYNNGYFDGTNDRYVATDFATRYQMAAGTHKWDTAPSGSAAALLTYTTKLALSNTGALTVTPSAVGANLICTAALSGGENRLSIVNSSNTAGSYARAVISVGGASADDPQLLWQISGVQEFVAGIDNSDGDTWKLCSGATVGSGNQLALTTDGRLYGTALHNNAGALTGTVNQYFGHSGTFTPAHTNTTNVAASTAGKMLWTRDGNVVKFSYRFSVDPTAASANTVLGVSIPIASNFTAVDDASGGGGSIDTASEAWGIEADTTNDRLLLKCFATNAANHVVSVSGSYEVK